MTRYLMLAASLLLTRPAAAQTPAKPAAKAKAAAAAPRTLLRGTWQAADDKNSLVVITDRQYTERYAGQPDQVHSLQVLDRPCDASPAAKPGPDLYLQTGTGAEATCYFVVSVSATRLQLSMVSGRGNTLSFKRVSQSPSKKQAMP
jgi:hypothetical protein